MPRKWNNKIAGSFIALAFAVEPVCGCGFYMPNRVLFEDYALKSPKGYFSEEVKRIELPIEVRFDAKIASYGSGYRDAPKYGDQTKIGDIADLRAALLKSSLSTKNRGYIVSNYIRTREHISEYTRKRSQWQYANQQTWRRNSQVGVEAVFQAVSVPPDLPGEFADYISGAISYHSKDFEKAIEAWKRLLDRPAEQRKYKSTWAAFMIAKALLDSEPGEAVKWFGRTRELARDGFVDSIGLAASSLGWEARAELNRGNDARAMELYLAQAPTGAPTAIASLRIVCRRIIRSDPNALEAIARNASARKVLTAYIVSHIESWQYKSESLAKLVGQWLEAAETAHVDFLKEADRLAWAAYNLGEMELTARWLKVAEEDAPMAQWLRAKLLLRAGKVEEAAEQLRLAARHFAPAINEENPKSYYYGAGMFMTVEPVAASMRGELGVLYLARRQYVEALHVLLAGGHWHDAAYVAERVLTPQELKEYVDRAWPATEPSEGAPAAEGQDKTDWIRTKIRYLLARRLGRLGKWADARVYYPGEWRERFDIYTRSLAAGSDVDLSKNDRAKALWKAAIIARHEGIELLGTEVEPDWFILKGRFSPRSLGEIREKYESEKKILPSTTDEVRRIQQHAAVPNLRYHYRYAATQHAWRAAELLPDDSDEAARVLCIAGAWIGVSDPNEADRFYKELVVRCPNTKIGQEAEKLRWFPKIEMDRNKLLAETMTE